MKWFLFISIFCVGIIAASTQYLPTYKKPTRQDIINAAKQRSVEIAVDALHLSFSAGYTQCLEHYNIHPSTDSIKPEK